MDIKRSGSRSSGKGPKYKHHQVENDRGIREQRRREKALDEAL
jgi:hypothetical protein